MLSYLASNSPAVANALYLHNTRHVPAGAVQPFAGTVTPAGWLMCDGDSYNINEYPKLYEVIGTTYGGGEGDFNVPDMRSRFPLASGPGNEEDLSERVLAATGGAETHTLTTSEMPSHNHGGSTGNNGAHYHTSKFPGSQEAAVSLTTTSVAENDLGSASNVDTSSVGDHNHIISSQGGGGAHNNMPPFMVLNYIIKF
jgi:microcystin-dependent protein